MVKEYGGKEAKDRTFAGHLTECWEHAMEKSDTQLKTAPKPAKAAGTKPSKGLFGK